MKNHPVKIEQLLRDVAEQTQSIQRERERIDVFESDITIEIHLAKGEDGKPLFSNDAMRKAAFVKRLADNAEYTILSEGLAQLEKTRAFTLAAIERLRLEFKLYLLDREEEINRNN